MHILGISNGTVEGNSEILLKAALTAATETDSSITTAWIHAPSVSIPNNAKPLEGVQDVSQGFNSGFEAGNDSVEVGVDDRRAVLDAILDADGLILATPVYSHSPAGFLKAVLDRILGPFTDVVFARQLAAEGKSIDERLLKPRVAGFIAIGGSPTRDQFTLALPLLHLMVYSLHAKVVDQIVIVGCGAPGSVIARHGGAPIDRAKQLGRNVASQLGKKFDDAQYLGPSPPGTCPYCHLTKLEMFDCTDSKNEIGCTTCGALGKLVVDDKGVIRPVWQENCNISSITEAGKLKHIDDLKRNGAKEMEEVKSDADFEQKKQQWRDVNIPLVSLPSQS